MIGQGRPWKTPSSGETSPREGRRRAVGLAAAVIGITIVGWCCAPLAAQSSSRPGPVSLQPPLPAPAGPLRPPLPEPPGTLDASPSTATEKSSLEFGSKRPSSVGTSLSLDSPPLAELDSSGSASPPGSDLEPDAARPAGVNRTPSDPASIGTSAAQDAALEDAAGTLDLRLRIVWGSGASRQWQGAVRIDRGTFSEFQLLGLEADEPGSMECSERLVLIEQPSPRAYDGLDLRVVAPADAVLSVRLQPLDGQGEARVVQRPLSDFIDDFHKEPLDERENRLLIRRRPGDKLRVELSRETLVLAPAEELTFSVQPHLLGNVSADRCQVSLVASETGKQYWTEQRELRAAGQAGIEAGDLWEAIGPLSVAMPEDEGVYDLRVVLTQRRLAAPLLPSRPVLERSVQLVVIRNQPPVEVESEWKQVASVDGSNGNWWERVTKLPQWLPGLAQGPLNNDLARRVERDGQSWVKLAPGGWQAYPLPVDRTGKPHQILVEIPREEAQALGISVLEPDAAGKVLPIGLDSGVALPDDDETGGGRGGRETHRLLFWPRTRTPLLLLTNRHPDRPALFGKIRLQAGPDTLPAAPGLSVVEGPPPVPSEPATRRLAAYYDKPLIPENFSAGEALDEYSGQSLDDWSTFYLGGRRLLDYLEYVGYDTALLSVACEGSAIYPSRILEPTPKYDTGTFFVSGQDPVRKDVLEMLFRLFDRQGLTLIPAVHFAARLPELERLRQGRPEAAVGLELVDEQGLTWTQRHGSRSGQAPYYNPLDPRVQQAMRRVVDELAARYGHHESFGGVALQIGPETYAQLPGALWALDDHTIERFELETHVRVPGEGSRRYAQRAEFLKTTGRPLWLRWRAEQLAKLYHQFHDDLQRRHRGAQLVLAAGDLFSSPHIHQRLLPTVIGKPDVRQLLLEFGLDPGHFQDSPGIVFPRPERLAPVITLPEQAVNLDLTNSPALDESFQRFAAPATLLFHEAQPMRLPSFDERSPFGKDNTYTWLVTHFSPAGAEARRRFVDSVARMDAQWIIDGGWMLPLGQEQELRSIVAAFRRLPAERFETLEAPADSTATQPLIVRRLARGGRTYVYLVNNAPWPVTAELQLEAAAGTELTLLADRPSSRYQRQSGGRANWRVALKPYDLVAGVFSTPDVAVRAWKAGSPPEVSQRIQQRIDALRERVQAVTQARPMSPLENAGFEQQSGGSPLEGWVHARGSGIEIQVDGKQHFGGQHSLRIYRGDTAGPAAWVRSEPFPIPQTGRLRVSVWLRTSDPARQPRLRLAVEGRFAGETYYRYASVGADNPRAPLRDRWAEYQFVVENLPLVGLSDLRVGFDLMGPGEVWVDDVRMFDLWLDKTERDELLKNIALADLFLDEGQLLDCERFLDSYWARFLRYHVPLPEAKLAENPGSSPEPAPAQPAREAPPSLLDRFKKFVPRRVLPF